MLIDLIDDLIIILSSNLIPSAGAFHFDKRRKFNRFLLIESHKEHKEHFSIRDIAATHTQTGAKTGLNNKANN